MIDNFSPKNKKPRKNSKDKMFVRDFPTHLKERVPSGKGNKSLEEEEERARDD